MNKLRTEVTYIPDLSYIKLSVKTKDGKSPHKGQTKYASKQEGKDENEE